MQKANVAEIEIYGKNLPNRKIQKLNGKPIGYPEVAPAIGTSYGNVFDNNLETYFTASINDGSWVGIDFHLPVSISKIKYCPRSDTNFMLDDDMYELCYWFNDKWVSMGKRIASNQVIKYKNVPTDALYILHNLSRGNEERIFTYQNGKQIWR